MFQQAPPLTGLRRSARPVLPGCRQADGEAPQDRFAKWHDVRDAVQFAFGPAPAARGPEY